MRYLLIVLIAFTSCVSLKPAKDIDKAENKIKKFNTGIMNQIDNFPSLVDEAFTITKYDTTFIPSDSLVTDINTLDTQTLDSIEREYYFNQIELDAAAQNIKELQTEYAEDQKLIKKLNTTDKLLNSYKVKADTLFNMYIKATRKINQVGTIKDDNFIIKYKLVNGKLSLQVNTKEKEIVTESQVTTNKITVRDKFYQDPKFWIGLVIVLTLLYFVGDKIVELWKSFIDSIISFIKRLILKL